MRSKRSKAWHRRKDERLKARALIEQGFDDETAYEKIQRLYGRRGHSKFKVLYSAVMLNAEWMARIES
jgi:hypothetical protein